MTCDNIRIPIDIVPGSNPPKFRWQQTIDTPDGRRVVVEHAGPLPPSVEVAVVRTIAIVKQLLMDNALLRGKVQALEEQAERADLVEEAAELAARGMRRSPPGTPDRDSEVMATRPTVEVKKPTFVPPKKGRA